MATLLLVDAPLAVRHALRTRLSLERDLTIVGEAEDGPRALRLTESLDPDVVLLDAEMPDLDVIAVVRALSESDPRRGIVVVSQHTEDVAEGLASTAAVVVGKRAGLPALVGAIRSVARRPGGRPD